MGIYGFKEERRDNVHHFNLTGRSFDLVLLDVVLKNRVGCVEEHVDRDESWVCT
jgi:hypothetical protein